MPSRACRTRWVMSNARNTLVCGTADMSEVSVDWHAMARWCWDAWPYEGGRNRDEPTIQSQGPEWHESTRLGEQDEARNTMISVVAVVLCVL